MLTMPDLNRLTSCLSREKMKRQKKVIFIFVCDKDFSLFCYQFLRCWNPPLLISQCSFSRHCPALGAGFHRVKHRVHFGFLGLHLQEPDPLPHDAPCWAGHPHQPGEPGQHGDGGGRLEPVPWISEIETLSLKLVLTTLGSGWRLVLAAKGQDFKSGSTLSTCLVSISLWWSWWWWLWLWWWFYN